MKLGDLVKFKNTGTIAMIVKISATEKEPGFPSGYASLYVSDGTLDNTPSANGFTVMSHTMLNRTAEVISESR